MSVLGLIALISGVLGVLLTIKQKIWCWPVSLIAVVSSIIEFYHERLFGDMALQIFYFFSGIYGWIYWGKNKNTDFKIHYAKNSTVPFLLIATGVLSLVFYFLLIHFHGDRPLFDGVLTACSLTATYMMTKKWIENWVAWIAIDASYVVLYGVKFMWLFSLLYLVFALMALYGWLKWKKTLS